MRKFLFIYLYSFLLEGPQKSEPEQPIRARNN